jgi:hypothetical protein
MPAGYKAYGIWTGGLVFAIIRLIMESALSEPLHVSLRRDAVLRHHDGASRRPHHGPEGEERQGLEQ